jgi:transcriptional regulator with XRE-family HTH domain
LFVEITGQRLNRNVRNGPEPEGLESSNESTAFPPSVVSDLSREPTFGESAKLPDLNKIRIHTRIAILTSTFSNHVGRDCLTEVVQENFDASSGTVAANREAEATMNLSKRIRDLRYAKGWGPDELASRAKISRTALYQIERGSTSKPQAGTLRRISRALGIPLEELLEITPVTAGGEFEHDLETDAPAVETIAPVPSQNLSSERAVELQAKFRMLLGSPLAEGVARIVEESFRLLPIIPPPAPGEPAGYAPARPIDAPRSLDSARLLEPTRRVRARSRSEA